MKSVFRNRIYGMYVTGPLKALAPATLDGLKPRLPFLRNLVRRHFPENRQCSIIDLGCGHGALIYVAKELGYENIWGVDASQEQVDWAVKLGIEGVELGDVVDVLAHQQDESVDCLAAIDLIEHFDRDEILELVDECRRVLKPGGRWIIHVPNAESPFGMTSRYGDMTHELAFTSRSLGQLFLSSGFSKLDCYEDKPIPHGVKSALRFVLWKILRNILRFYVAVETGNIGKDAILSQNMLAVAIK